MIFGRAPMNIYQNGHFGAYYLGVLVQTFIPFFSTKKAHRRTKKKKNVPDDS